MATWEVIRTQELRIHVEADNEEDAIDKAKEHDADDWTSFDTEYVADELLDDELED